MSGSREQTTSDFGRQGEAKLPMVVCVASGKGGVGKTSVTLSLAHEISYSGRVLVVDLDYFNLGATSLLQERGGRPAGDVPLLELVASRMEAGAREDSPSIVVDKVSSRGQIYFCPCSELPKGIACKIEDSDVDTLASELTRSISSICRDKSIDCVVIDAHGGPDILSFAAYKIADHTLLVSEPDKVTLYGTLNFLARLKESVKTKNKVHLVFNRVSAQYGWRGLERLYHEQLTDLFDGPLLGMIPFNKQIFDHFGDAPFVVDLFPKSAFARKVSLIVRGLFENERPSLVRPSVMNWSHRKVKRINHRLQDRSLACPRAIAWTWFLAFVFLFLAGLIGLFFWNHPVLYSLFMGVLSIACVGCAIVALVNSIRWPFKAAATNLRFLKHTEFGRLYAVKFVINILVITVISIAVLGGFTSLLFGFARSREKAVREVSRMEDMKVTMGDMESTMGDMESTMGDMESTMGDKSEAKLHAIYSAVRTFTEEQGEAPPDLAELVAKDYLDVDDILSPFKYTRIRQDLNLWDKVEREGWFNANSGYVIIRESRNGGKGSDVFGFGRFTHHGDTIPIMLKDGTLLTVMREDARFVIEKRTEKTIEQLTEESLGVMEEEQSKLKWERQLK